VAILDTLPADLLAEVRDFSEFLQYQRLRKVG
jgi:hypothetical protein